MIKGFVGAVRAALVMALVACGGSAQVEPGGGGDAGAGNAGTAGEGPLPVAGAAGAAGTPDIGGAPSAGAAGSPAQGGSGGDGCQLGGETYPEGAHWKCDCNECWCYQGKIASTAVACPACTYDGQERYLGQSFPSTDGCNTCRCDGQGGVTCTEKACACNPSTEWNRHYVSDTKEKCALIDFACTGNTKPFVNPCGCGCEQDADCPQQLSCFMDECAAEKAKCPYSKVGAKE